jgi:hypothetical protein
MLGDGPKRDNCLVVYTMTARKHGVWCLRKLTNCSYIQRCPPLQAETDDGEDRILGSIMHNPGLEPFVFLPQPLRRTPVEGPMLFKRLVIRPGKTPRL